MAHQTHSRFAALLGMINRRVATSLLAIGLVVGGIAALAWAQNASLWNPGTQPQAGMGSGNTKIPAKAAQNCQSGQFANGVDAAGQFTCATISATTTPNSNDWVDAGCGGQTEYESCGSGNNGTNTGSVIVNCQPGEMLQIQEMAVSPSCPVGGTRARCVASTSCAATPAIACYRHEFTIGVGCNTTTLRYSANGEYTGPLPANVCSGEYVNPVYAGSAEAAEKCSNFAAPTCVWSSEVELGSETILADCINTQNNIGKCAGDPGGTSPSLKGNRHECITRIYSPSGGTCWLYGRTPVNATTGAACSNVDP